MDPLFYWTGVGTRYPPAELLPWYARIARALVRRGGCLSTGDAIGSDEHFVNGQLSIDPPWRPRIFYTSFSNRRGLQHDPSRGFYEAEQLPKELLERAWELALKARGSAHGLGPAGIGLHRRNPFQVLGPDLESPSKLLVCCAKPVGKKGRVDGGTNTAVQVALSHDIPVYNLWVASDIERLVEYIKTLPLYVAA